MESLLVERSPRGTLTERERDSIMQPGMRILVLARGSVENYDIREIIAGTRDAPLRVT